MKTTKCLTALAFATLLVCQSCTPRNCATTSIEYGPPNDPTAENAIRAHLQKNDPTAKLTKARNTNLFEIMVYDSDPKVAATRADQLTAKLRDQLILDYVNKGEKPPYTLKIWERGTPHTTSTMSVLANKLSGDSTAQQKRP